MKKQYATPSTAITHVATQNMICGSITESGSSLSVKLGSDDTGSFGNDNTINSRRGGSFWEDEE